FFQAEDGIRDDLVTGVQTCALPIYDEEDGLAGRWRCQRGTCRRHWRRPAARLPWSWLGAGSQVCQPLSGLRGFRRVGRFPDDARSEERRVGKECRSGWCADHEIKTV